MRKLVATVAAFGAALILTGCWFGAIDSSFSQYVFTSYVPGHVTAVPDPEGSNLTVAKFSVGDSDQPYPGSEPRADLMSPYLLTDGSTKYVHVTTRIPAGLPPVSSRSNPSSWFQFAQSKDIPANAWAWSLGLNAYWDTSDDFSFSVWGYGVAWTGPRPDGHWHRFVVEVHTTSGPDTWERLWYDGQPVTFNRGPQAGSQIITGYRAISDSASAWPADIDSYRSRGAMPGTVTIYHGPLAITDTLSGA